MIQIGTRPVGMKTMGLEEKSRIPFRRGDSNGFYAKKEAPKWVTKQTSFTERRGPKIRGIGGGWMCPRDGVDHGKA